MRDLTLQESRDYTYEGRCRLWGQDVFVGLDLPEGEDKARALEAALPAVEQRLEWLENNRAGVEKALLDDGGPDLAQDWASSAELAEEEDAECYIMEDGQKVFFPITPEAFCASLQPESLVLNGKEGNGRFRMELMLVCDPDYFAGHALEVCVEADGTISSGGLFG